MIAMLQRCLQSKDVDDVINSYLRKTKYPRKWILLTDYCLDAQNKSNVITYVLLHYLNEDHYQQIVNKISELQKSDIKHTRYISNKLMRYLRNFPIFSFSFILNDRNKLFGETVNEEKITVANNLKNIKSSFETWLINTPNISNEVKAYYNDSIAKLDKHIKLVSNAKKVKLYEDILLTASLGSTYVAGILKKTDDLKVFGWMPDRDKITQSCDQIAFPIFHGMLHNQLEGRNVKIAFANPNQNATPFYDSLNRIPDDICAAIADHDFSNPSISKEKFSHVLFELMCDNPFVRVYRITKDSNDINLKFLSYKTTPLLSLLFYFQTTIREVKGFIHKIKNKMISILQS